MDTNHPHTQQLIDSIRKELRSAVVPERSERLPHYLARLVNRWLKKFGYMVLEREYGLAMEEIARNSLAGRAPFSEHYYYLLMNLEKFDATYALFDDEESRKIFDWCVWCRFTAVAGFVGEAAPPLSEKEVQAVIAEKNTEAEQTGFAAINLAMLELGQYSLPACEVCAGDVVIDAGGYRGETARLFQEKTGTDGTVYVFEPVRDHQERIAAAIKQFHWENVKVIPSGLWNEQGKSEITVAGGSSSMVMSDVSGETETIALTSLDDFVHEQKLDRVDFIKMDIEGAEQNALIGAQRTLKTFKPKLAISIYHLADDLVRIPEIIMSTGVNYRFFLRHYTASSTETVFYAVPQ